MANLDAAGDMQHAVAIGRQVAFDHVAQVGDAGDARIAIPVGAGVMAAIGVAATDEIGEHGRIAVDDDRDRVRQADRADEAGAGAGGGEDLLFAGQYRFAGQFGQLAGLDLVDLVVAAQAQRDQSIACRAPAAS